MKKPGTSLSTLADTGLTDCRCSNCCEDLPGTAPVEMPPSYTGQWIVAHWAQCDRWTPFPLPVPTEAA